MQLLPQSLGEMIMKANGKTGTPGECGMQLQQVAHCTLQALLEWNRYILLAELQAVVVAAVVVVSAAAAAVVFGRASKQKSTSPVRAGVAHQMHLVGLIESLWPRLSIFDCVFGYAFDFWFFILFDSPPPVPHTPLSPHPTDASDHLGVGVRQTDWGTAQTERQRCRQLQLKAAQNCNFKNKVYAFQKPTEMARQRVRGRGGEATLDCLNQ